MSLHYLVKLKNLKCSSRIALLEKETREFILRQLFALGRSQRAQKLGESKKKQEGQLLQTESAHLTWLYRTMAVQKAFQSDTV